MPEAAMDGYNSRLACEGLSLKCLEPVNRPDKVKSQVATSSQSAAVDNVKNSALLRLFIPLKMVMVAWVGSFL